MGTESYKNLVEKEYRGEISILNCFLFCFLVYSNFSKYILLVLFYKTDWNLMNASGNNSVSEVINFNKTLCFQMYTNQWFHLGDIRDFYFPSHKRLKTCSSLIMTSMSHTCFFFFLWILKYSFFCNGDGFAKVWNLKYWTT